MYGGVDTEAYGQPGVAPVAALFKEFRFWLTTPLTGVGVKLELIEVWVLKHTGWLETERGLTEFKDHGNPLEPKGFAGFAAQLLYE